MPTQAAAPYAHWFIANATNSLGCAVFVVTSWKKFMHRMMKLFLLLAGTTVFSTEVVLHFLLLLPSTFFLLLIIFLIFHRHFAPLSAVLLSLHFQSPYEAMISVRTTHAEIF